MTYIHISNHILNKIYNARCNSMLFSTFPSNGKSYTDGKTNNNMEILPHSSDFFLYLRVRYSPKTGFIIVKYGGGREFRDWYSPALGLFRNGGTVENSIPQRRCNNESWARDNFCASRQRQRDNVKMLLQQATTRQILASGSRDNVFRDNYILATTDSRH